MNKTFSAKPETSRFSPWLATLLGIVAIKAVLSLSAGSLPFAYRFSGISYLLLLLLATAFSIRNAIHNTLRGRPFWRLLAAGCGLWTIHQSIGIYYDLLLNTSIPDNSISDDILFIHLVPFMAAVSTLPNLRDYDGKPRRWVLDTLLILGFWAFLYGFMVAQYKYLFNNPGKYGARFDLFYLIENLVLILSLGVAALRAKFPWKKIYLHLLGASGLYALSSTAANIAIDVGGGYVTGKLYGLGLTASACWFVWVPLSAREVPGTWTTSEQQVEKRDSPVSAWAVLLVVMISLPMAWELTHRDESGNIRALRVIVAISAIVLLAVGVSLKEYLERRELAWSFNRRLIQAQEEERIRIARELNDDICQRMAAFAIRLEQLKASLGEISNERLDAFSKIQKEVTEVSTSIVHLTRELHSPTLEILGLGATIRSWCIEFSENRKIEILFESHDLPPGLSLDISNNLYRVLQEALNNAAKHSGDTCFDVELWGTQNEIHLSVVDHGKGFDIDSAMRGHGFGLKSMRERVKFLNGHLTIKSRPNQGTTIHARVPVDSRSQVTRGIDSALSVEYDS